MISKNIKYKNIDSLKEFINDNKFINDKSILVQIFSGVLKVDLLEEIASCIYTALPHSNIIGSTTDGEIINKEVCTSSIIITFSTFKKTTIKISHVNDVVLVIHLKQVLNYQNHLLQIIQRHLYYSLMD